LSFLRYTEDWNMILERFPDLAVMSDEDKLVLMTELWENVTEHKSLLNSSELTLWVQNRWEEYQDHPDRVSSWNDVKARVLAKRP
jgi:hypothetical protein